MNAGNSLTSAFLPTWEENRRQFIPLIVVKLKAKEREAAIIGSFIDFIAEQGWELAEFDDKYERLLSICKRPDEAATNALAAGKREA